MCRPDGDGRASMSFLPRPSKPSPGSKTWETHESSGIYLLGLVDGIRWYARRTWALTGEGSPVLTCAEITAESIGQERSLH